MMMKYGGRSSLGPDFTSRLLADSRKRLKQAEEDYVREHAEVERLESLAHKMLDEIRERVKVIRREDEYCYRPGLKHKDWIRMGVKEARGKVLAIIDEYAGKEQHDE